MQALLLLGGLGGLFLLLSGKKGPGKTVAAEVPKVTVPKELLSLPAISKRFDEVKTLYRMGRLDHMATLKQLQPLVDATRALKVAKEITADESMAILKQIHTFAQDVGAAQAA